VRGGGHRSGPNRLQSVIQRVDELRDAVIEELSRHLRHIDSGSLQIAHDLDGVARSLLERGGYLAVLREESDSLPWKCIDRLRTDQWLNIHKSVVGRVLRAGAGPQEPLRARPSFFQGAPTSRGRQLLETPIRDLGVRDRTLAEQALCLRHAAGELLAQLFVDARVDPTQEEARYGRHARQRLTGKLAPLERADVCKSDLLIALDREQQRSVYVDSIEKQSFDSCDALERAGDLDEQIRARHCVPQAMRLRDGTLGVMCEVGRDFEADKAVASFRAIVHWAEYIAGGTNVRDDQRFVDAIQRMYCELPDLPIVGVAGMKGRPKDRGIRRARFMTVLKDQRRPSVLLEGGYLSNPEEAKLIATPEYRQKLAEAVAEALGVNPPTLTTLRE